MRNFRVIVNDNEYTVAIEELTEDKGTQQQTSAPTQPAPQAATPPRPNQNPPKAQTPQPAQVSGGSGGTIIAPMPGTILKISVTKGDTVTKGQTLLVLEAMKMENEIQAPSDGVVQGLNVAEGASVNAGDVLIVLSA